MVSLESNEIRHLAQSSRHARLLSDDEAFGYLDSHRHSGRLHMGVSILFAVQKGGAAIDRVLFKNAYSKLDNTEVPRRPLL